MKWIEFLPPGSCFILPQPQLLWVLECGGMWVGRMNQRIGVFSVCLSLSQIDKLIAFKEISEYKKLIFEYQNSKNIGGF